MRIIVLASALASGLAAIPMRTVHVQQFFKTAACDAANLVESANIGTGCQKIFDAEGSEGHKWQKVTCNATHVGYSEYSDAACATEARSWNEPASCTGSSNRFQKYTCDVAKPNLIEIPYTLHEDAQCTKQTGSGTFLEEIGVCRPDSVYSSGAWTLKANKVVYTPGVSVVSTMYNNLDCSGAPAETNTYACGACDPEKLIYSCPVSWGRRSTPGAAATFGAAAFALAAARRATA